MIVTKTTSNIVHTSRVYKRIVKRAAKQAARNIAQHPQAVDLKTRLNEIMHKRGLNKIFNKLFPKK